MTMHLSYYPVGAIPDETVRRTWGMGAYQRHRARARMMGTLLPPTGFGQADSSTHWYDGIVNWAENVAGGLPAGAPEAGGGWVSQPNPADSTTNLITGTDPNGNPITYTVPATWTPDQINANLAQATGAGTTPPVIPSALQIPSWLWWVGGGALALALLGYSGVGKLIPQRRLAPNPKRRKHRAARRRARARR